MKPAFHWFARLFGSMLAPAASSGKTSIRSIPATLTAQRPLLWPRVRFFLKMASLAVSLLTTAVMRWSILAWRAYRSP